MNKEMRVDFIDEGMRGRGIVDHGGGKRNMFAEGFKAILEAGDLLLEFFLKRILTRSTLISNKALTFKWSRRLASLWGCPF